MITYLIIALTVIVSLICFSHTEVFNKLSFKPFIMKGQTSEYHRFLSHAFVHADIGHLAFNMLTLFFFGPEVEKIFGSATEYLIFYAASAIFACLPSYQNQKKNNTYVGVGASGAVASIMFVLVLYAPWSVIYLKFIIPIYYILFAVGYIVYCSYQVKYAKDNIAHDVHMWGSLFGLAYMLIFHPSSLSIFLEKIQHPPF